MPTDPSQADLIIRNARLIDGLGQPAYDGAIAVTNDRISAMGQLDELHANVEIDAGGQAIAPGFIDVHTHDDRALLSNPLMANKVSQGVTTVVTGNCGISLAPLKLNGPPPPPLDLIGEDNQAFYPTFSTYLDALDQDPPALNTVCQVGHSSLRIEALDSLDRPADARELKHMCQRLDESLSAGAIGLSTGLFYRPAHAAPTAEIIALGKIVQQHGALHSTHMRDEGDHIHESLQETFTIGREAQVPVVISHHKCTGAENYGRSQETLALIDQAKTQQAIGLDAYPYVAGSTVLDPQRLMGASRIMITWSKSYPEYAGRDLHAIAAELGLSLQDTADRINPAGAIYFTMHEDDVRRILAYPHTMIGSDGLPHDAHPHPRLWGTFPRVLGHYARDVGLFTLEEAVRKMTSLPAAQFGLADRGVLRPGAYTDLVLFDPTTVNDRSTWEQPTQVAEGIDLVLVNGRPVWRDGATSGQRPGRALRLQDLGTMGANES